jgi:MerR family transcriptional regulator, copper efflux regulator
MVSARAVVASKPFARCGSIVPTAMDTTACFVSRAFRTTSPFILTGATLRRKFLDPILRYRGYSFTMIEKSKSTFTVGEVARRAGVSTQTIHYYERCGLLPRARRNQTGYRLFGREVVGRTRFVRKAQTLGFTLEEIKDLLSLPGTTVDECAQAKARAERKIHEIDMKLKSLRSIRRALVRVVEECADNQDVGRCPMLHVEDVGEQP